MTWLMWAAAAQIRNGCSDDGFEDFRRWLIGLGREAFERVVQEPDRLAELPEVQRLSGRDSEPVEVARRLPRLAALFPMSVDRSGVGAVGRSNQSPASGASLSRPR